MLDKYDGYAFPEAGGNVCGDFKAVREKKPGVWNETHEELAKRILETCGQKVF